MHHGAFTFVIAISAQGHDQVIAVLAVQTRHGHAGHLDTRAVTSVAAAGEFLRRHGLVLGRARRLHRVVGRDVTDVRIGLLAKHHLMLTHVAAIVLGGLDQVVRVLPRQAGRGGIMAHTAGSVTATAGGG